MGVPLIVLLILAMKLPILALLWFVFWVGRVPESEPPGEEKVRRHRPRRPEPPRPRGPRRRDPHGGSALKPVPGGPHGGRAHPPAVAERLASALRR